MYKIKIGEGSCGISAGAGKIHKLLDEKNSGNYTVHSVGCIGMCFLEPIVDIYNGDALTARLVKVSPDDVDKIISFTESGNMSQISSLVISDEDKGFLEKQTRIALRGCGITEPESIEDYEKYGGYTALSKVLKTMTPEQVIEEIKTSGLAGRGGAGFPTWFKWNAARQSVGDEKYLICNADEGDPGAFMDRAVIESDPHALIEGMLIAAYAIGAKEAIVYVRAEYPLAIKRLRNAIEQAVEKGYIGENILSSDFSCKFRIKAGAGAFVCGEETALIESLEGQRGMPRLKPPFPAQSGYMNKPSNINNVETFANVTWIINNGGEAFAAIGTETSKGTKVFALTGKIKRGGLVEIPMGKTLRDVIFDIGGGPGGISAAYYLAIKGHGVTVFDMMPKMGGMLRYGIPQYRLPKEVLDKELALVEKLGVEFRNNIKIGRDISLDTLNQEYDAVIAAPGAWSSTKMRVDGENAEGVFGGIDFLRSVILGSPVDIGKRVAVCGGGNTAMDACRTAVRLGAEKVYIIYRRTRDEMPADALEIDEAQEEGVDFRFLTNPDKILTQDSKVCGINLQIMELGEPDASGRRKPVPIEGKFETLEVDSVIMAIGQRPELSGFEELDKTSRGTISADESTFRTNINGIFAIGDATNKGADIAISAIGEAQKSVAVVDSYLRGNIIGYKKPILVEREINKSDLADREHIAREKMRVLPAEERKHSFDEVALGLTDEQARREASRCLECGCLDYYRCKLINYANKYNAEFERFAGQKSPAKKDTGHKYILRDSGKCILCGLCVRVCSQVMGVGAIGLAGRGFTTVVSPEFYKSLGDSQCISCGQCVSLCPTGALVEKVPFQKDVPLREIRTATHCTGCAAKCAINVFSSGSSITRCEPANGNIICTYGKFGLSKLANVSRLKVCKSGEETISLERAAEIISEKTACFSPAEIAVTVCENMTDNELEKAAELSRKLGCALVDMGNIDRDISADNCERFEKIFGTDFYIGANREKTVSLGAVDSDAIDFSKIKAVISFGGKTSEGNFDFAAVQSAKETGDVSLPFALSVECVGTIGEADISPALNPTYSNEEIIDAITAKIK